MITTHWTNDVRNMSHWDVLQIINFVKKYARHQKVNICSCNYAIIANCYTLRLPVIMIVS